MDANNIVRDIFILRANAYQGDMYFRAKNLLNNPNILNASLRFGLFDLISHLDHGETPIISKQKWFKKVWQYAWPIGINE